MIKKNQHDTYLPYLLRFSLAVVCLLPSHGLSAHCRMSGEILQSVRGEDRVKLTAFHQQYGESRYLATRPLPKAKGSGSPPITGIGANKGDGSGSEGIELPCAALFSWITGFYNSAFCHLKAHLEEQGVGDHVQCLWNYPGTPESLSGSMTAYSIATDDAPVSALLKEAVSNLSNHIGELAVCDGSKTLDQYRRDTEAFIHMKTHFELSLEEYEREHM